MGRAALIVACVAIPLLLALVARWLPPHPAIAPSCAGLTLAACLSLPWTGTTLGLWLEPDPLGVHVAVLASFAWLAATLLGPDMPVASIAGMAAAVNLGLLAGSPELTVAAGGAAVIVATLARPGGAMPAIAVAGLGLALFGLALLHAAQGAAGLRWDTLAQAGEAAEGGALGVAVVLTLLGMGCTCLLIPIRAALLGAGMPGSLAVLTGPLAGLWLVVALRLRGVLDTNAHAIAPGPLYVIAGFALMLAAILSIRAGPGRVSPGALLGVVGAVMAGFGIGGAGGTAAGLLHLTIGCLALVAAQTGGLPGLLGQAALAGVPPLGVFASAYGLFGSALANRVPLALGFGLLDVALVVTALRQLVRSSPAWDGPRFAWASLVLTLLAGWALPGGVAAWLLGIAAAAR